MTANNTADAAEMPAAREVVGVAVINWLLNGKQGPPSRAVLSALDEAGFAVVPLHSCPHCGAEWTTTVLVDAAVRCPNCAQPDERWTVTLAARTGEEQGQ